MNLQQTLHQIESEKRVRQKREEAEWRRDLARERAEQATTRKRAREVLDWLEKFRASKDGKRVLALIPRGAGLVIASHHEHDPVTCFIKHEWNIMLCRNRGFEVRQDWDPSSFHSLFSVSVLADEKDFQNDPILTEHIWELVHKGPKAMERTIAEALNATHPFHSVCGRNY